jgi:dipeptidase
MMKINFVVVVTFVVLLSVSISNACTNYLISKGATVDGSTMITYTADAHTLYGELYYRPAGNYLPGTMLDVYEWDTHKYLGKIKQALRTYSVVGNMNEFQVSVGETTFGGREELADPKGKIDYGSLMFIGLQRSRTARECIHVMTQLANEYGYCSEGESFSIADPNEVWIMEMIGKGPGGNGALWIAMKVPEGYVCAHANQARIRQIILNDSMNCYYSKDLISFARTKGWYNGADKDFSFVAAYARPDFGGLRFCEARVWSFFRKINSGMEKYLDYAMGYNPDNPMPLFIKPERKLDVHDVIGFMRDHFEGTPMDMTKDIGSGPFKCPYRWRPLDWTVDSVKYFNERAASTQQTGFSFVAQARSWLPSPIGGIFWFGVDDTYSTVYVPMYCGIRKVPVAYAEGTGSWNEFSWNSAWWVFNFVANYAYSRYMDMIQDIQVVQRDLEGNFIAMTPEIDQQALSLYKSSPESARDFLADYSCKQGEITVEKWTKLGQFLIWKYLDGNVKDEFGKPHHLGYPPDWYKRIVNETGDHYKEKKLPKGK